MPAVRQAPVTSDLQPVKMFFGSHKASHIAVVQDGQAAAAAAPAAVAQHVDIPKILLVTPWYGKNGVGLVVEAIARSMREMGGTCVVLRITGDGWLPSFNHGDDGELIVSLCARAAPNDPTYRRRLAALLRTTVTTLTLRYLVRRYSLQIAHFHYSTPEYDLLSRVSVEAGLQCVATFHGNDLVVNMASETTLAATTAMLQRVRVVTTVSHALNRTFVDRFPGAARIARTVHNAVPTSFMHNAPATVSDLRDIDVLFVGDLTPRKGVDVLIQAVRRVTDAKLSLRAVIVGHGVQHTALIELARECGLEGVVEFVGWKDRAELSSLYCRARVLAVPSRAEPFGLVIVEAQLCGAVVIASAVGGIPEIITDGQTGFLVPPDDPEVLASTIGRVLGGEQTRASVATMAREHVLKRFSPACMASRYRDAYLAAMLPPSDGAGERGC